MSEPVPPPPLHRKLAVAALVFGVLTLASGGRALFGGVDMGRVVPFVLWFNFLAGFLYVAAALALWTGHALARPLAVALASATALVFAAFGLHVLTGGAFEPRTVAAMTLRTLFWTGIALALRPRPA